MNKIIIITIIIIIILGGLYLLFNNNSSEIDSEKITPEKQELIEQKNTPSKITEEAPVIEEYLEQIINNPLTKNTTLKDVTGKASTGTAYILRVDNSLTHYIQATLPDPKEGNQYEGWLVKKTPTLTFFSTGVLIKEANGNYILRYGVDDFDNTTKGLNFVVVTEETVIDETPETHILEGTIE